jgi:hypothetical protein
VFTAALLTIAKLWQQSRCPTTDEWIKKMWYLCQYHAVFIDMALKSGFVIPAK